MNDELYHYGVLGMRRGVRRYRKKDGTLTNSGKRRYNKEMQKLKNEEKIIKNKKRTQAKIEKLEAKRKSVEELKKTSINTKTKQKDNKTNGLSNEELREIVTRLQLEKQYNDLSPKQVSLGKAFTKRVLSNVVVPAAEEMGKQVAKSIMTKLLNEHIKDESLKVFTNNNQKK